MYLAPVTRTVLAFFHASKEGQTMIESQRWAIVSSRVPIELRDDLRRYADKNRRTMSSAGLILLERALRDAMDEDNDER